MRRIVFVVALTSLAFLLTPLSLLAQGAAELDQKIHDAWPAALQKAAAQRSTTIAGKTLVGQSDQAKRQIYRDALLLLDADLGASVKADLRLVTEVTKSTEREFIRKLKEKAVGDTQAKSVDATATNPAAGAAAEKSGFAELLALALRANNFFNADATAVSLNLSALALYSLADPNVYSELYRYQQHSALRRLGGTVVFGSEIPEKEITGISGFPSSDTLVDVFTWDVKYRLLGDRDPRSRIWYEHTLGRSGLLNQFVVIQADVDIPDLALFSEELASLIGERLATLKRRINRSPQLTVKTAGTHLSKQAGSNKYTFGALYDQGFGERTDLTANLLYSVSNNVSLGADKLFQVKQVSFAASVTAAFVQDTIVKGRSMKWTNGTVVNTILDKASLPVKVKDTWKVFSAFEIPMTTAASIPVSVVFTNDKNELKKTKYMSGFVGVTYDFSAVGKLFGQ